MAGNDVAKNAHVTAPVTGGNTEQTGKSKSKVCRSDTNAFLRGSMALNMRYPPKAYDFRMRWESELKCGNCHEKRKRKSM